jgi:ABC-2 type transport system permease protein
MIEASGGANSLATSFLAMLSSIMAILISVPVVGAINRLYSEEKRGRLDAVLAGAVPRTRLFGGFVLIAVGGAVVFAFLSALGLYATASATGLLSLGESLKAQLVYLPALFVMAGVAILLVGAAPKLTALIWVLLAYSFATVYIGRLLDLPELALKIAPFGSVPQLPVQEFTATPLIMLCAIAIALAAVGIARYRRRDMG